MSSPRFAQQTLPNFKQTSISTPFANWTQPSLCLPPGDLHDSASVAAPRERNREGRVQPAGTAMASGPEADLQARGDPITPKPEIPTTTGRRNRTRIDPAE